MERESNVFDNILVRSGGEVIHSRFYQYVIGIDAREDRLQTLRRVDDKVPSGMQCIFNPIVSNLVGSGLYTDSTCAPRGADEGVCDIDDDEYRDRLKCIFTALSEYDASQINWQSIISLRCLRAYNDCKLHSMSIETYCAELIEEYKSDNLFILSVSC